MTKTRIAIVGLNFGRAICDQLMREPACSEIELAAVVDLDPAKAETEGRARNVPWFHSLDAVLADPGITAIGLFTGPVGRAELLTKIIRAGRHVITTKPFEHDPRAAAAVLAEARALGRVLHCNSPAPISTDLNAIRDLIIRHDLGRIVGAHAEVWANYREQADGSWYDDPLRCPLPPIYRLGIYLINDIIALLGRPAAVQAQSSRIHTGRPTADHAQLAIRFANGALGSVFSSFCIDDGDQYRNGLTLHSERGTIYRNVGPVRGTDACELSVVQSRNGVRQEVERLTLSSISGDYAWAAFNRACHGQADTGIDSNVVVGGLQVIEAMATADRERREVALVEIPGIE